MASNSENLQRFSITGLYKEDFVKIRAHEDCALGDNWPDTTTEIGLYIDFDVVSGSDLYELARPIQKVLDRVILKGSQRIPAVKTDVLLRSIGGSEVEFVLEVIGLGSPLKEAL